MTRPRSMKKDPNQPVRARLSELLHSLQLVESTVCVATAALEHQNCDADADVAKVLKRTVNDRISTEIEKTSALLATLMGGPRTVPA